MIIGGAARLLGPRRMRLLTTGAAVGAAALAGSLVGSARSGSASTAPTRAVVVLTRPIAAGSTIDPARLAVVQVPAGAVPDGALAAPADAAFRRARIALPAGLPLVPSLLGDGASATVLAPGERAVGVRVDEASGARGLIRAGSVVDVVAVERRALVTLAVGVAVVAPGDVTADGAHRVVVLRVPVATARRLAAADLAGLELRLLAAEAG